MRKLLFIVFMSLSIALAGVSPVFAAAYNPLTDACNGVTDSPTCSSGATSNTNPLTGTNGTILKVANIVALVAGIAAVIMIIISGIQYMTASGDAQKAAAARRTIIGAVIGLFVIVAARFIVTVVVKGIK